MLTIEHILSSKTSKKYSYSDLEFNLPNQTNCICAAFLIREEQKNKISNPLLIIINSFSVIPPPLFVIEAPEMNLTLEFGGGAELLFNKVTSAPAEADLSQQFHFRRSSTKCLCLINLPPETSGRYRSCSTGCEV